MDSIDWEQLRREVRLKHGRDVDDESFGTEESRLAICHLIGDEALRAAVDYCVDMRPGVEMARCALMILRPAVAVERCLEIYRTDPDRQRRLMAAGALSWVASFDDLPIVAELFQDSDPAVQTVGATVLDQLIFTGHAHVHQAEPYLRLAEDHSNPELQTTAANIRDYLERRGIPRVEPLTDDPAEGHCAICGSDLDDSPAIRWASLPHLVWHLSCDITDKGRAWFEGLRRQHPALDREVTLATMGQEQRCPACSAVQLVNPTAVGHDPSGWAVNCSSCGEAWLDAINGYKHPDLMQSSCGFASSSNAETGTGVGRCSW